MLLTACRGSEPVSRQLAFSTEEIILVTIDTWRADAAGFAGNTGVKTPFLDGVAARGTVFSNAHAHNVVTLPSHANILTGLYPYQHGVRENAGFVLDPKVETIAETLQRAGWSTGAFVGAFPLDSRYGLKQGFDVYDDNYGKGVDTVEFVVQERPADAVLDSAARWWQTASGKKRFLWIHLYDPHAPYFPPPPFNSAYPADSYLGEVAAVDDALSRRLGPLIGPGTTIIVTSDHGEARGDHGEVTHGLFAYESTLKVPLLVAGPGVPRRVVPANVRHIDIVPTILESAGMKVPETLPGRSLFAEGGDRDTYFESLSSTLNRGWAPLTGIIHGGEKYIDLPIAEFYDLKHDPAETKNLRAERRREVERARGLLASFNAVAPTSRAAVSGEEAARLRSLGYVAGSASAQDRYTERDDPKTLLTLDRKMHEVVDAYQRGDKARSLEIAREVVAARPDMAAGRELLAFVLQENERLSEAIEILRALERDNKAVDSTRVRLGLLLTETRQLPQALEVLTPLAPGGDPEVLNAYGIALADHGRVQEAVRQFERVLQKDPNNAPALQNLGVVALRRNDLLGAADLLQRALDLNPKLPLALNTLGVVRARQGDFSQAVQLWGRAVSFDPRQYDALFNLGLVQARSGNRDAARRALQQFVETAPPQYAKDVRVARGALTALR